MKNLINRNTGLLLRIDDVAENMSWNYMDKCEKLFEELKIKPLVGIIPENKDPDLLRFPKNDNFWNRVSEWKNNGWEISMHGFNHVYDTSTKFKDFFKYGGPSEFFGHDYNHQHKKIKLGLDKLKSEGHIVKSFFAPNHTYDLNTFLALKNNGVEVIIDGYGLFPYFEKNLTFIPQLFYKETFMLPFGFQSTQIHMNNWDDEDFKRFKEFLIKTKHKILCYNEMVSIKSDNKVKKILRELSKFALINLRKLIN
jgi:predicted deacetylase